MRSLFSLLIVLAACHAPPASGAGDSADPDSGSRTAAAPADAGLSAAPATPTALLDALAAAEREGRFVDTLALRLPAERATVVYSAWFGAAYNVIGKSGPPLDEYRTLVERHGLDEAWLDADATGPGGVERVAGEALAHVSLGECYQDFARFSLAHGRHGVAYGFGESRGGIDVDGDTALARVGERTFTFVRESGAWYWHSLHQRD